MNKPYEVAKKGQHILVTNGVNRGKVVKVTKVNDVKVTFRENFKARFVSHGDYQVVRDNEPTAPTEEAVIVETVTDNDDDVEVGRTADINDTLIENLSDMIAARAGNERDVDELIQEVTHRVRNMSIQRVRTRRNRSPTS